LGPAVWPPLEERKIDFNGVLAEFMALLGERVRIEVGGIGEHTRAVICGELCAVGDATGAYASFVVGDAAAQEAVQAAQPETVEITAEMIKSTVNGAAAWWYEHREVPRDDVVSSVMGYAWLGMERLVEGARWEPGRPIRQTRPRGRRERSA
jgi:hypothetical protein